MPRMDESGLDSRQVVDWQTPALQDRPPNRGAVNSCAGAAALAVYVDEGFPPIDCVG